MSALAASVPYAVIAGFYVLKSSVLAKAPSGVEPL